MKKFTEKQIREAIAAWEKRLAEADSEPEYDGDAVNRNIANRRMLAGIDEIVKNLGEGWDFVMSKNDLENGDAAYSANGKYAIRFPKEEAERIKTMWGSGADYGLRIIAGFVPSCPLTQPDDIAEHFGYDQEDEDYDRWSRLYHDDPDRFMEEMIDTEKGEAPERILGYTVESGNLVLVEAEKSEFRSDDWTQWPVFIVALQIL